MLFLIHIRLKNAVIHVVLFTILVVFSGCKSDIYEIEPDMIVIIKADDLGNITPNWERFIQTVKDNNICASIGIISSQVSQHESVLRIKEISQYKLYDSEKVIEFWNHGFDHYGTEFETEFWGTTLDYQIDHIRKSQQFFKDSLGIQCKTFSTPFNRTSVETYDALQLFSEINVIMYHRKSEKCNDFRWQDAREKKEKVRADKVRLRVEFQSVYDVPLQNIKKYIYKTPKSGYVIVQIHPNSWDESDFSTFQEMITFFKKMRVKFMTPQQYYQYLHN